MQERTLADVRVELVREGHSPMVRLLDELEQRAGASQLVFDTSMLRLLLAMPGRSGPQVVVTYADGRGGGRPLNANLDAFDLLIQRIGGDDLGGDDQVDGLSAAQCAEFIERWSLARPA